MVGLHDANHIRCVGVGFLKKGDPSTALRENGTLRLSSGQAQMTQIGLISADFLARREEGGKGDSLRSWGCTQRRGGAKRPLLTSKGREFEIG
jgi:hypothetical protein